MSRIALFSAFSFFTTLLLIVSGTGCSPSPAAALDPLKAEWTGLVGANQLNPPEAQRIAAEMVKAGGNDAETWLLDSLADPKATPIAKVMAVAGLSPVIHPEQKKRVLELTDNQYDSVTRGCAAHLLSAICLHGDNAPDLTERLHALSDDTDGHVRHAAILALQLINDPEGIKKALALWKDPKSTPQEREGILQSLSIPTVLSNPQILVEALQDNTLSKNGRFRVLELAEKFGDTQVLDAVKIYKEKEKDPDLQPAIDKAIQELQNRADNGLVPVILDPKDYRKDLPDPAKPAAAEAAQPPATAGAAPNAPQAAQ